MSNPSGERSENDRYQEARALSGLRAPALFEQARALLGDSEWRIRRAAWEAVLAAGADFTETCRFFLVCLEDEHDAGIRGAALEALISLAERAVPFLTSSLPERSPRGRRYILDVLSQIRSPSAAAAVRALVDDPDENVGFAAAEVLGLTGDSADIAFLLNAIDRTAGQRKFAMLVALVQLVKRVGGSLAVERLEKFLSDPILRAPAIELLGLAGGPGASALLWNQVVPGRPIDAVILALRQAQDRETVTPADDVQRYALVLERTRVAGLAVRRAAFDVIAATGPAHLAPLVPALAESDGEWLTARLARLETHKLRELLPVITLSERGRSVAAALYRQRPELDGESALLALLTQPGEHRGEVIAALAAVGTLRSAPHLISLCKDADSSLAARASSALSALAKRGVSGLEELLMRTATAASPEVLMRLLPTIGQLTSNEQAIDKLCLAMRHAEAAVRRAAVGAAVPAAHLPEVSDILLSRLADEDEDVRSFAAEICGRSGLVQSAGALEVLLDDPSPWVQATALNALGNLSVVPTTARLVEILGRGGVAGVTAAHLAARQITPGAFDAFAQALDLLDDDTVAELLKALTAFQECLSREQIKRLRTHPSWNVRAAVVQYLADKQPSFLGELGREWLPGEEDDLVRMRLRELVGG